MNIKTSGFVRTALSASLAACLVMPSMTYALGVGKVQVRSALNQPLNAELELFAVKPNDLANLDVKISTQALAGNISSRAANFDYSIETRGGRYYLKLISRQPIREPLLNFLVEVQWPQGRLLRELAIFLDPPTSSVDLTLTAGLPPRIAPRSQAPRTRPQTSSRTRSAPASSSSSGEIVGSYGPVKRGETLWRIADRMRPEGVSIPQMMQALFDSNPRAFSRPGLDHLMAGVTLQVPTVGGASPRVANASAPSANSVPASVPRVEAAEPPQAEEQVAVRLLPPTEQVSQAINTNAPGSASTEQEGGSNRVRIANLRDLQAQVQMAQSDEPEIVIAQTEQLQTDTSTTVPSDNVEATAPVGTNSETAPVLEPVINTEELELAEEPDLVATQLDSSLLAQPEELSAVSTATAELALQPEEIGAATTQVTDESEIAQNGAESTEAVTEDIQQTVTSEPVAVVAADPAPSRSAGFDVVGMLIKLQKDPAGAWRDLQQHPLGLPIAGGVLIVLLLLIATLSRRSRKAEDYTEIDRNIALSDAAVRADKATKIVPHSPAEEQTRLSSRMRLQRVDFLIAGGSYQEAERILRRALSENPFDLKIKEKMLDLYFKSGNTDQFITVAESVRGQIDDEKSPLWQRVIQLGEKVYPGHPLFEQTEDEQDTIVFTPDSPADSKVPEQEAAKPEPETKPTSIAKLGQGVVLDFEAARSSNVAKLEKESEKQSQTSHALKFTHDDNIAQSELKAEEEDSDLAQELDKLASNSSNGLQFTATPTRTEQDVPEYELDQLDLNFNEPKESAAERAGLAQQDFTADADSDRGTKLPDIDVAQADAEDTRIISAALEDDADPLDMGDSVEIKLDLASAYLEMEDQAGAASLLQEVISEGSDQQQSKAREMLAQMNG